MCVYIHKHTSMHTGSTAVFGQSNLACDLPCAGPPTLYATRAMPPPLAVALPRVWRTYAPSKCTPLAAHSNFIKSQMKADCASPGEPRHSVTNQTQHRTSERFATWESVSCSFCHAIKHRGTILSQFTRDVFHRFWTASKK